MKKLKRTLLLVILLLIPVFNIKAGTLDSYIDWTLDRSVFAHQYKNGKESITNLAMIEANGKIAYCIEPGILAEKQGMYNSSYNTADLKITITDLKRLSLIGYYGYGYNGHEAKEYYMATQELIWRMFGVENAWWTDSKEGGNTFNIEYYKNEILKLVDNYEVAPTFDIKDNYIVGEEIVLEDKNNVLNEYDIELANNIVKDDNKIKIKLDENNNFKLKRKSNGKRPIFYYKDGKQTIASFEYAYDFSKDYNIKASYGKIIVDKYDFDTKDKVSVKEGLNLEGATYELFDINDNLIYSAKTDSNGIIIFDNLEYGTYYIKEKVPSIGYTLDDNKYTVILDSDNLSVTVKSYEKIIENIVNITKVLNDTKSGIMSPEDNITFGIYDENETLVSTYTTNSDGKISFELPYGRYILKQLTSPVGVLKVDDRIIEIKINDNTIDMVLVNELEKLPNTGKKNYIYFFLIQLFLLVIYRYARKSNKYI